jgi:hypothetical protein
MGIAAFGTTLSPHESRQFIESSYSSAAGDMTVSSVSMPAAEDLRPEATLMFTAERRLHFVPLSESMGLQVPFQWSVADLRIPPLSERQVDLDVSTVRGATTETVRVQLPASIGVIRMPEPVTLEIPEASYRFTARVEDDALVFEQELVIEAFEISSTRCAAFGEFLGLVARAERSMVEVGVVSASDTSAPIASTQ